MKVRPLNLPLNRCPLFMALCLALLNGIAAAQPAQAPDRAQALEPRKQASRATPVDFVRDIQPILRDNCYECHAGNTEEGGLNLGIQTRALRGGDSGPAIVPGKSDESLLIQMISGSDEDRQMPPEGKKPLTDEAGPPAAYLDRPGRGVARGRRRR